MADREMTVGSLEHLMHAHDKYTEEEWQVRVDRTNKYARWLATQPELVADAIKHLDDERYVEGAMACGDEQSREWALMLSHAGRAGRYAHHFGDSFLAQVDFLAIARVFKGAHVGELGA